MTKAKKGEAGATVPKKQAPKKKVVATPTASLTGKKIPTGNNGTVSVDFGVSAMTVAEIKSKLTERDLSTNGVKKVLSKRLVERLAKEEDPAFKPKPKGRFCKVCTSPTLMRKRSGVRGPFFGCTAYPLCTYTENRGYAMVNNVPENWRE